VALFQSFHARLAKDVQTTGDAHVVLFDAIVTDGAHGLTLFFQDGLSEERGCRKERAPMSDMVAVLFRLIAYRDNVVGITVGHGDTPKNMNVDLRDAPTFHKEERIFMTEETADVFDAGWDVTKGFQQVMRAVHVLQFTVVGNVQPGDFVVGANQRVQRGGDVHFFQFVGGAVYIFEMFLVL